LAARGLHLRGFRVIHLHPVLRPPLLVAMLAALAFDQVTKAAVIGAAPQIGQPHELPVYVGTLFNGLLTIEAGANAGLAFSSGSGLGGLAGWLAAIVVGVVIVDLAVAGDVLPRWVNVGLGLVLGGALGNLVDRVRLGSVLDFLRLDLPVVASYIFNLADLAIIAGIVLLVAIGPSPWRHWARAVGASRQIRDRFGKPARRA
jgi:signal peptidase II